MVKYTVCTQDLGTLRKSMKPSFRILLAFLSIVSIAPPAHSQLARSVDPFLGATGGGNVFPAPPCPSE
jgi:hypothetical protein